MADSALFNQIRMSNFSIRQLYKRGHFPHQHIQEQPNVRKLKFNDHVLSLMPVSSIENILSSETMILCTVPPNRLLSTQ